MIEEVGEYFIALHDIFTAHLFAQKLVDGWDHLDDVIRSALSRSIITIYARPFVKNRRNIPGKKSQYPISGLKTAPGFDRDLHDHICTLRQTLVAHKDTSVVKTRIGHTLITPADGGIPPLPVQTFAKAKAFHAIAAKEFSERYLAHILACRGYLSETLNSALEKLHMAGVNYPEISATMTKSLPLTLETRADGTYQLPNIVTISEINSIDTPNFPVGSYVWLEFTQVFELINTTYKVNGEPLFEVFDRADKSAGGAA